MDNSLLNYMNKRLTQTQQSGASGRQTAGPVITISRDVGCGGLKTARKLANSLNEFLLKKKWQVVSKEILSESARELELDPQKIDRLFSSGERFVFDEILSAFNDKKFKSEQIIRKAVKEVVRTFAISGGYIIVGRAAHIIAKDIRNSLHIKLVAPIDWRIEQIADESHISKEEALKFIQKTEQERAYFRKQFMKGKETNEEFDLVINVSKFEDESLIRLIRSAIELKGMITYQPGRMSAL